MSDIIVHKLNEVFLKIKTENSIKQELSDAFSFYAENYRFHPSYRQKFWDGKVRLYNIGKSTLFVGLLNNLIEFAELRNYTIEINYTEETDYTPENFTSFIDNLSIPFPLRDYQINSIEYIAKHKRGIICSPTGSGKSATIYGIIKYINKPTLLVVPNITLITQMYNDLISYGYNKDDIYCISAGINKKDITTKLVISTWQSIYTMPKNWFSRYEVAIVDECHLAKAKSITGIMNKMETCQYRIGTTGTLDDITANKLTLTGEFGPVYNATTTAKLIEKDQLSKLKIKIIKLLYNDETCKLASKFNYNDEREFITQNKERNVFLCKLAIKCAARGNTIILFNTLEQGNLIYNTLKHTNNETYYIAGNIKKEAREQIRQYMTIANNVILVASYGTCAAGINIPNIQNIIFASPSKSKIRVLQSIGRGLRLAKDKLECVVYDIIDFLQYKKHINFSMAHGVERLKIYDTQKFDYSMHEYNIK